MISSSRLRAGRPAIAALLSALLVTTTVDAAEAPISPGLASLYVGRDEVVEGKVEAAEVSDSTVRLRLGPAPQSLTVSLVIGLLSRFPAQPEKYYVGKTVRVAGTIERFRNAPEITVHDPEHIQVIDPAKVTAAAAAPVTQESTQLRQQIDQLNSQVKDLESRLRQLEHEAPQP